MSTDWLVDAGNPQLSDSVLTRIGDPSRPDRLAWNTFRTLALWDSDVWVPRLVEIACGDASPLTPLEWSGATVEPWGARLDFRHVADVLIEGTEGLVVVLATFEVNPPLEELLAGALESVADTVREGTQAGLVVVVPPGAEGPEEQLEIATSLELVGDVQVGDFLFDANGWLTWRDLGELALDVAEESDELRAEQVHRLIGDLQERFPHIDL